MPVLLAISSSPRRNGNSELLLKSFCAGAESVGWKTDFIRLNDCRITPCQACDRCEDAGACVLNDDMRGIFDRVLTTDALVLASPVYFGSISAQAKMFIDRFQCWWHAKYRLKKPFVSTGENRRGYFICVAALRKEEFCESAAAVAGVLFHNLNYKFDGSLCLTGFDKKGSIRDDEGAMEKAFREGVLFANKK